MAITLPGDVVWVIDLLGFNWPDINEDELRDLGSSLRALGGSLNDAGSTTWQTLQRAGGQTTAKSYTALLDHWLNRAHGHVQELQTVCGLMADGLEVAAVAVEAIKGEILASLVSLAAQITADTVGAFFTFGATEAEAAAATALTREVVGRLISRIESEVIGKLTSEVLGGLSNRIDDAVNRLVYDGVAHVLD